MNYLLIPGNPPAVHFYEAWREHILRVEPGAKVRVSVYPLLEWSRDSEKSMGIVLAAHAQQLRDFHNEVKAPVRVVGHSLGGYFALRLLEYQSSLLEEAILVHPFLRSPTPRGRLILNIMSQFHRSEWAKSNVVKWRRVLETLSKELPFVSDEELLKTFHLAKHESVVIGQNQSPLTISPEIRKKLRVFYTLGDTWCTPKVVAALESQIRIQACPEPHDFVTQARHRESLFERIRSKS